MNLQAVIFDLDGVICRTDHLHYLAWKTLANRLHISFDEKRNNLLRGVSRMKSLDIVLGSSINDFSPEEKIKLAEEKNEIYRSLLQGLSPADLSPEVVVTLNKLREMKLLLAIGSSSKNTRSILENVGLGQFFDAVADGTQIHCSKPDPEVFLLAANLLNVAPENAIVVEDATVGIQAAKNGNFCAVGIGASAKCSYSDYHINNFSDIYDICSQIVHDSTL